LEIWNAYLESIFGIKGPKLAIEEEVKKYKINMTQNMVGAASFYLNPSSGQ